jgi:hypothetical protein
MSTHENLKLTVEELKRIKGFENMNEEKALEVIETMFRMAMFAFNAYNKENVIRYE